MIKSPEDINPKKAERLQKLAATNFSKFAIQVEHLSAEVQAKLIEQLPEFQKLATRAMDQLSEAHRETLRSMDHSEDQVHQGFEEWRAALAKVLDDPDLTLAEKLQITSEIGATVRQQAAHQKENHRAKLAAFGSVAVGSLVVVGTVVIAVAGGKLGVGQGDKSV